MKYIKKIGTTKTQRLNSTPLQRYVQLHDHVKETHDDTNAHTLNTKTVAKWR